MSKNIYLWRKEREALEKHCETAASEKKKYNRACGVATTLPPDAEQEILEWVNALRREGVPVSNVMLRQRAKSVAAERGISPFEGSWSWRKAFRKRYRLSIRAKTRQGQIPPEEAEARAVEFGKEVQRKMSSLNITTVHNADQTGELVRFVYIVLSAIMNILTL